MVSRLPILLLLLFVFFAEGATATQMARHIIRQEVLPKLVDPQGAWHWKYYNLAYRSGLTLRGRHWNDDVLQLVKQKPPQVLQQPSVSNFLKALQKTPSSKLKIPMELKDPVAEVWIKNYLPTSATYRESLLGKDWQTTKTYQGYLTERRLPPIEALSEQNIMNYPIWVRFELIENRIQQLQNMSQQQGFKLIRYDIVQELGYTLSKSATSRWIAQELSKKPHEMIQLLKSETLLQSAIKKKVAKLKEANASYQPPPTLIATQAIIDDVLSKLFASRAQWTKYYYLVTKLRKLVRASDLNEEVIKRLRDRGIPMPRFTKKHTRGRALEYKFEESPTPAVKEVIAEVWVQQKLATRPTRMNSFLGEDWQTKKIYKQYLGSKKPNLRQISEDNIMNLPLWVRSELVEEAIHKLQEANPGWTRLQIAIKLGYQGKPEASSRWLSIDILTKPNEMIKLLKPQQKQTFVQASPPAPKRTPRGRARNSRRARQSNASTSPRRRGSARQRTSFTTVRPSISQQASGLQTTLVIKPVTPQPTPQPTPHPTPRTAPPSVGTTTPPGIPPTPIPTPLPTRQVVPLSEVPEMGLAWD